MPDNETVLRDLRRAQRDAEQRAARAEALREQAQNDLRRNAQVLKDLGFNSVKAAQERIDSLQEEIDSLVADVRTFLETP